jgi:hypothetical protein
MDRSLEGYDSARKAFDANVTRRYVALDSLEKWVAGTQYDGRDNWWTDEKPLWERAPCIVYPIVQIAIQSNVDLCLGDNRFPSFSMKPGEDEGTEQNGLGEEASAAIDRFLAEYHKLCRFKSHARDAFSAAQGCGTAVAIHGARGGVPFADLFPAKWCTPKLGSSGEALSLEVKYPYLEEYRNAHGKWAVRTKLYRRVIDAQNDVTYLPADADERGIEPNWSADPDQTFSHKYGFCPVIWYPFMRGCVPVNVIDGKAIHAHVTDEIEAHDLALSQRHRGALLSEPQACEIGVSPGYNPTELGRTAAAIGTKTGGPVSADNPVTSMFTGGGKTSPARKKGPGYVWQYTDNQSKVQYLCYPADALKAQTDNAADLQRKLQESLAVVMLGPDEIKAVHNLSGKALEAMKQKQIDRCDQFRCDLEDHFFLPSCNMQLRIAAKLGASLRVPGSAEAAKILKKFEVADVARPVA